MGKRSDLGVDLIKVVMIFSVMIGWMGFALPVLVSAASTIMVLAGIFFTIVMVVIIVLLMAGIYSEYTK